MELQNTIKNLRTNMGLSQEQLADAVYVTRQTVSSWENGKSYPDVKSLVLLANFFGVSLDILIKGDVEKMKEISKGDIAKLNRMSLILALMYIPLLALPVPLAKFLGWWGFAAYLPIVAAVLLYAFRVERFKKEHDIQTYREISAFMEGKRLDEASALREEGKRPYQKVLLAIGAALLGAAVAAAMFLIFF